MTMPKLKCYTDFIALPNNPHTHTHESKKLVGRREDLQEPRLLGASLMGLRNTHGQLHYEEETVSFWSPGALANNPRTKI